MIHPHTENSKVRQQHHRIYQLYNRLNESEIHAIVRGEFHADYLVLADGPCDVRCMEGQTMDYVANSIDAFGQRSDTPFLWFVRFQ